MKKVAKPSPFQPEPTVPKDQEYYFVTGDVQELFRNNTVAFIQEGCWAMNQWLPLPGRVHAPSLVYCMDCSWEPSSFMDMEAE